MVDHEKPAVKETGKKGATHVRGGFAWAVSDVWRWRKGLGAEDGARTRDLLLGKEMLYH